jgi:hypothetical protein
MNTKHLAPVFLSVCITAALYGAPAIQEADVPIPETYYELPPELAGEFIVVSPVDEALLKIFANNKYIAVIQGNDYGPSYTYGHVIRKGETWYFNPIKKGSYFEDLTEIHITGAGFHFYRKDRGGALYRTVRMPEIPEDLPLGIAVDDKRTTKRYFALGNNRRAPVDEIVERLPDSFFSLYIEDGLVYIYDEIIMDTGKFFYGKIWRGFLELEESRGEDFSGVIHFTNNMGYYYTEGKAKIEQRGGTVTITAICSVEMEALIKKKYPAVQTPAYLVLEFEEPHVPRLPVRFGHVLPLKIE